ncbi:transmembrane 6 superfamily member 1 [Elysia marginata]|uniref:Transmembrane 6 superfamily member 1 n=1 Tax=Elysia marginata TaxID=1093978 RepID=A0AAV4F9W1_9GAST|nr:transmembrane 6 superfamily member 1 [Elysia marginata]
MPLTSAAVVFMTSLMALPMSYILNSVSHLKNQLLILVSGLIALCIITLIPWLILRQKLQKGNPIYHVLGLLAYSSVMSLIIALENDGLIAEFMGSYLREGEPYLKTAHGTMVSYWDGIAHYAMYLMMLAAVSWNQTFHDVGLYWVGSFGYSKLVLVVAAVIGKDGFGSPFLLIVPYIVICAMMCVTFIKEKCEEMQQIQNDLHEEQLKNKDKISTIWRRPMDLLLFIYFIFAVAMTVIRFSGAMHSNFYLMKLYKDAVEPYLTDPSLFSRAQLMVQSFYFIPYYMINMYCLLYPSQSWLLPLCIIFAGASAQAQFSLIGSSFHYRTPYLYRVPQTLSARCLFWFVNGLQFLVPQIMANRCITDPSKFLRPAASPASPASTASQPTRSASSNGTHDGPGVSSRRRSSSSSQGAARGKKLD